MSFTIVEQPDEFNFSSSIRDFVITSDEDLIISVLFNSEIIIQETYTPDVNGNIYVRDLGKLLKNYLSSSGFENDIQNNIVGKFKININEIDSNEYSVIYCDAIPQISADEFFKGNIFLHNVLSKKWVTEKSKEYLSLSLTEVNSFKVYVFITQLINSNYINSESVLLYQANSDEIKTLDVSFNRIKLLFPDTDPSSIVAYRIQLPKEIAVYFIDRNNYLLPLEFRFLNLFNVPESLITRGEVFRKGISEFKLSKIGYTAHKYDIVRNDEFKVASGKIFSQSEYVRYQEFFNSENVEIYFLNKWRKVIVKESENMESLRKGNLQMKHFSFSFADTRDNNVIIGEAFMQWILADGTWSDTSHWLDSGKWIDNS